MLPTGSICSPPVAHRQLCLLDDGKTNTRLAAFRPGVAFGEFALFDGGRRVANVVAETAATCYVLQFSTLKQLETAEPELFHLILFALGRLLSDTAAPCDGRGQSTFLTHSNQVKSGV